MNSLYLSWLDDQVLAFWAAILIGNPPPSKAGAEEQKQLARATTVIFDKWRDGIALSLSDTTLSLLQNVSDEYDKIDDDLDEGLQSLAQVRQGARAEVERREKETGSVSPLLINHAAYVLKQQHLDFYRFLKWFVRNARTSLSGGLNLLKKLSDPSSGEELRRRFDKLLDEVRDPLEQTRDRVRAIDDLYSHLSTIGGSQAADSWLLRLCLALRNTMYCWPLMIGGTKSGKEHGISLPIGVFLSPGGNGRVFFKDVLPRGSLEPSRPYVQATPSTAAHIKGSKLCWDRDWANAVQLGAKVAKELWRSQNGRLRFVDAPAAANQLSSSVVVDVGAACAIVDAVYGSFEGGSYLLKGRSAEAYWTQIILGLLLPAREIPFGVVTGRIEELDDGAYTLRHVEGIEKKLEYANSAGFSRVVLPGIDSDYARADETPTTSDERVLLDDDEGSESPPATRNHIGNPSALARTVEEREEALQEEAKREVRQFLDGLSETRTIRRIELNFCQTARAAADAMQPSGWRRAAFMRLPETQREFSYCLRRLFLMEQKGRLQPLSKDDERFYRRHRWQNSDQREVARLDEWLISGSRCIKFVRRDEFDAVTDHNSENSLGKWLAWKDHQIRTGAHDEFGMRGPGLGILCLRTVESDNEMRLWLAVADTLAAGPKWVSQFQWAGPQQAARLLAALLGNRRADPDISLSSAPDVLVILDEGNLTQHRTNRIFPDDFRGNWLALINPTKDDRRAPWPLETALYDLGVGALGRLRVIVIYGEPNSIKRDLPDELSEEDRDILNRFSVYRFGFSKQSAYAIINHDKQGQPHITWSIIDEKMKKFRSQGILRYARGQYYLAPGLAESLRSDLYWKSHRAHLSAARALAPIVDPNRIAISSNRDRSLEPEPVLESLWHLRRARMLIPGRGSEELKRPIDSAFNNLVFLQPFADWDAVKSLQHNSKEDAIELGRELLAQELVVRGYPAHSSRVARLINVIGEFGSDKPEDTQGELASEATELYHDALSSIRTSGAIDYKRQKTKLLSDYLYSMKRLKTAASDPRLEDARDYLNKNVIREVVASDFFDRIGSDFEGLVNYPVSYVWLRSIWNDESLDIKDRARATYVATRVGAKRARDAEDEEVSWDGPWIELFALHSPLKFDPPQLKSPLTTWNAIYGLDEARMQAFADRVLDSGSFRPRRPSQSISPFGQSFDLAIENLWVFIAGDERCPGLPRAEAQIALKFVRAVGLLETIPAYSFLRRRDMRWLGRLPTYCSPYATLEWRTFAQRVIGSQAAWVHLLASIDPMCPDGGSMVRKWLDIYIMTGSSQLDARDPENLVQRFPKNMELSQSYRQARRLAVSNGMTLLGRRSKYGRLVEPHFREALDRIVSQDLV